MSTLYLVLLALMLQVSPESELPENLVFVTRQQYARDHHNTATLFQKRKWINWSPIYYLYN